MKKVLLPSLVLCLVLALFVLTPSAESMDFVLPLQATGASIQSSAGTYTVTEITGPNVSLTADAANEVRAVLGENGGILTVSFSYDIAYKDESTPQGGEQINLKLDGSLTTGTSHTVTVEADQLDDTFPMVIEIRNLAYEKIESVTVYHIHFVGTPAQTPTPTPSPTATPEPTETPDPSDSPEVTGSPEATDPPEPTESAEPSESPTATPTLTPTPTASIGPTASPTPAVTATPTVTPTAAPTDTAEPTATPTAIPSATATAEPAITPEPTDEEEEPLPDFDNNRVFGLIMTLLLLLAIIGLDVLLIIYRRQVISDNDIAVVRRSVNEPAFDRSPDPENNEFAEETEGNGQPRRE